MFKSQTFDSSIDRTKGEQCSLDGAWFQFVGDVPVTLKAILNEQSGRPFTVVPYQVYRAPFRAVYLFHAAGLAQKSFDILVGQGHEQPVTVAPELVRTSDFTEIQRVANVFKSGSGIGNTFTLWTPVTGKKIRLLGYYFDYVGNAALAVAGAHIIDWKLGATVFWSSRTYLPAAAPASPLGNVAQYRHDFLGNGIVAQNVGDAMTASCASALSAGSMELHAWGCEE